MIEVDKKVNINTVLFELVDKVVKIVERSRVEGGIVGVQDSLLTIRRERRSAWVRVRVYGTIKPG